MTVEKVCKRLIIKEPFWGLFLLGLNKRITKHVQTMAVAKSGVGVELLINENFWNSLSETEQLAILLHELHHLCFNHLYMGKDFPDQERFNIACDAEVNCYIEGLPPNDGHVDVEKMGLPKKQGAKWYYENMPQLSNQSHSTGGSTQSDEGNLARHAPNLSDDHSTWKEFTDAPEAQQELIKNHVQSLIKTAALQTMKQRGTIPGHLKQLIDGLLKDKPRIYDWRTHLRRMLGTEIDLRIKKSYQRASKRFPSNPGVRFQRKVNILVGVDTSGSINEEELSTFFSEINHIYKAGAKVHVIECDAEITSEWDFVGKRDITITGRGGTSFKPMVDYYKLHKKEYTMFVIFTDGYAPTHNLDVPNNDMTWVITSEGDHDNYYPGKVIFIPKSQDE